MLTEKKGSQTIAAGFSSCASRYAHALYYLSSPFGAVPVSWYMTLNYICNDHTVTHTTNPATKEMVAITRPLLHLHLITVLLLKLHCPCDVPRPSVSLPQLQ